MVINGKPINPGDLRTRITLQRRTTTADAGGFMVPAWATLAVVWARWTNVHGSEVWAAQAMGAEQPATALIRYYSGLDPTCAVLLGTVQYEIVSLDDIQDRHEWVELKVRRMGAG